MSIKESFGNAIVGADLFQQMFNNQLMSKHELQMHFTIKCEPKLSCECVLMWLKHY